MKTLTCAQMGGPCDMPISADNKDDMMKNGMAHMEAEHPEMAADVKALSPDSPEIAAWMEKFNQEWDAAPENAAEAPAAEAPAAEAAPAAAEEEPAAE